MKVTWKKRFASALCAALEQAEEMLRAANC